MEVLSADSFVVSLRDWSFAANEGLRSCAPASATNTGSAVVVTPQGVAYELMAALANAKGADLWVCVPLLADDGYVREMANLLKAQVQGECESLRACLDRGLSRVPGEWRRGRVP